MIRYINGEVNTFENKYGSNGMPDKSANGMLSYCKSKGCKNGKIADLPDVPGILLFSDGHVGVYIGGGKAIEARGFDYGVVETVVKNRKWTAWSYMPDSMIEYDMAGAADQETSGDVVAPAEPDDEVMVRPLGSRNLREGCSGDDVLKMQELLNSIGFSCGNADGDFGPNTESGLKEFQCQYKLEVDGVYGPKSHSKLMELTNVKTIKIKVTGGTVNIRTVPDVGLGVVVRRVKAGEILNSTGRDAKTSWYRLDDGNYISYKYAKEI